MPPFSPGQANGPTPNSHPAATWAERMERMSPEARQRYDAWRQGMEVGRSRDTAAASPYPHDFGGLRAAWAAGLVAGILGALGVPMPARTRRR